MFSVTGCNSSNIRMQLPLYRFRTQCGFLSGEAFQNVSFASEHTYNFDTKWWNCTKPRQDAALFCKMHNGDCLDQRNFSFAQM